MRDKDAFVAAAADAKRKAHAKAGISFSKQDEAALRSALAVASDQGLRRLEGEWGGWCFRFDIQADGNAATLEEVTKAPNQHAEDKSDASSEETEPEHFMDPSATDGAADAASKTGKRAVHGDGKKRAVDADGSTSTAAEIEASTASPHSRGRDSGLQRSFQHVVAVVSS